MFKCVTLSTQYNVKQLQQLKSGFKRTINWNKYQPKVSIERPNHYLDYLIDPNFQGAKYCNVMIDGQNFFNQQVKSDMRKYDNIRKIGTGWGHDYKNDCLLDYPYFKELYKMIVTDLSKQQPLTLIQKQYNKLIL